MTSENRPVSKAEQLHRQAIETLSAGRLDDGMALLKKALAAAGGSPTASSIILNDMGTACWQKGRNAMAEKHYRRAVELAPHNARALGNFGAFLVEQRRLEEAEPLLTQALRLLPGHYKIQNDMGRFHFRKGNVAAAEKFYRESIRLNPTWANAHTNLGELLTDAGRFAEAESEYQQALQISPNGAAVYNGLGRLYARQRQDDAALAAFDRALGIDPALERTWERKLTLLERAQLLDEAEAALQAAKKACPQSGRLAVFEAKLLRRRDRVEEALRLLEGLRPSLEKEERRDDPFYWNFLFELGELYDRTGDADKAFDCMARAKAGEATGAKAQAYDRRELPRRIALLREGATAALVKKPAGVSPAPQTPVFLVGFPRSGTTLLDQILSSHPGIRVADEKPALDKVAQRLTDLYAASFPRLPGREASGPIQLANLVAFKGEEVSELRDTYFAAHSNRLAGWNGVFVDKLPLNIVHVPLIARIFPGVKFILALRHPCDAVLSAFLRRFEFNPAMVQFLALEDAANFYNDVFGLWAHYREITDLDVHEIRYEDVVGDFRPTVEKLLKFLNVPWDDAVLDYDKTAREKAHINTPSYDQVTQKIYTRASGRWKRYEKHLQSVIPVLEPWVRKFGY